MFSYLFDIILFLFIYSFYYIWVHFICLLFALPGHFQYRLT